MTIETPADAFAAVAALVVGADRLGTEEERRFIFDRMSGLPVFEGLDSGAFAKLMADTTREVWSSFPTEGGRVTDDGVSDLLGLVSETLTPELGQEAFRMAAGLARADGMTPEEERLLDRLRERLGVDPTLASELMGRPTA